MNALTRSILFLSLLIFPFAIACPQKPGSETYAEILLKKKLDGIRQSTDDVERLDLSSQFVNDFGAILKKRSSFSYPFDSLKGITSVSAPDSRFRLFTWTVSLTGGGVRYFGLGQGNDKKNDSLTVIRLVDRTDSIAEPETFAGPPDDWYGAVYYEVIPVKVPGQGTVYTLLGWKGISPLVCSRLIEPMIFKTDSSIVFGSNIFSSEKPLPDKRIIFRYSARASMVLTYEKQAVVTARQWNASRHQFETKRIRKFMIVCDRILPSAAEMEGRYEYYLPSSDVMDGYVFENGCWNLLKEIDARNPVQKTRSLPKNPN